MKKTSRKYVSPSVQCSAFEGEGIICLSARVTVDEAHNMNADDSVSEPYLEEPIVF